MSSSSAADTARAPAAELDLESNHGRQSARRCHRSEATAGCTSVPRGRFEGLAGRTRLLVYIVCLIWLCQFLWVSTGSNALTSITTNSFFLLFRVYETYYLQTFLSAYSPSDVAWIGSIQAFAQFSITLISGPITDRYGAMVR